MSFIGYALTYTYNKEVPLPKGKLQKIFDAGFSITEVLIGGAILAGVALSGARMFKDQRTAQSKVDQDQILMSFHQNLTKFIQDAKNCNATFNSFYNMAPASIGDISAFYGCDGCTAVGVNYDASSSISPRTSQPYIAENSWIENVSGTTADAKGLWKLKTIDWATKPTNTGPGKLRVTYQMKPYDGLDPDWVGSRASISKTSVKDISVTFRFTQSASTPVFKECVSTKESSMNNLQNDMCGSMVSSTGSTGILMEWDDITQSCKPKQGVRTCSDPNMIVEGITSTGLVRCRALTDGVTPGDLVNDPDADACASGTLRMVVIGGRLQTVCD